MVPSGVKSETSLSKAQSGLTDSRVLKSALNSNSSSNLIFSYVDKLILAAQVAISQAKKEITEVHEMKKSKLKLLKALMEQKTKHEVDHFRRNDRKARHIDINGLIDSAIRSDGLVKDIYSNRIVNSKPMGIFDYRYKQDGTPWKPTKFTQEELLVLHNVKRVMVYNRKLHRSFLANSKDPLDMRLIRGPNGRGLGDLFLEKKYRVFQNTNINISEKSSALKDSKKITLNTVIVVDHYEEDERYRNQHRESVFH